MAEERTSNYIKLCDEWAEKFLQMEKKELMNRLPELKEEDGYLKITHFGVPFGIRLDNGRIDRLDGRAKANATEMLNIYTLLGYVKENAFLWTNGFRLQIYGMHDRLDRHTRLV